MAKKLFVVSLAIAFFGIASSADAQMTSSSSALPTTTIRASATGSGSLQDLRKSVQDKRQQIKSEAETRRAAFKEQLKQIQDTRKQAVVERIDTRLTTVNTNRTTQWNESLMKLESVLARISTQAATLKTQGKDTTALDAAIVSAQTALTSAKSAVASQSAKDYVFTIGTETTLKTNVGTTTSQFRNDLRATMQLVVAARLAVAKAASELKKLNTPAATGPASSGSATIMNDTIEMNTQ